MAERVELELAVLAEKAIKSVDNFTKTTQKQLDSISFASTVSGINAGFELLDKTAGSAFRTIKGLLGDAVNEALESEKATVALANSMRLLGDFSQSATEQMGAFADQLAKTTDVSDDQVISALSLAKSFRLTNDEAKQVVKAAADLAAITGQDLNSATETLSRTFNGLVSKDLKSLIPELRNLTKEQLAAGDAVQLVGQRFLDSAQITRDTFGGSVRAARKSFSELLEEIGKVIINNQALRNALVNTSSALDNAAIGVKENASSFDNFITNVVKATTVTVLFFKAVSKGFLGATDENKDLQEALKELFKKPNSEPLLNELEKVKKAAQETFKQSESDKRIKQERELVQEREKLESEFQSKRKEFSNLGLSEVKRIEKQAAEDVSLIRKSLNAGVIEDQKEAAELIAKVQIDSVKKVEAEKLKLRSDFESAERAFDADKKRRLDNITRARKEAEDAELAFDAKKRAQIEEAVKEPLGFIIKDVAIQLSTGGNVLDGLKSAFDRAAPGLAAGFLVAATKGAQGAVDAVSGAIGFAVESILPGFGAAAQQVIGFLAQGPEKVRETISAFVAAIPQVIENIILSLPALVGALIDSLSELPAKIIERLPEIITKLISELPKLIAAFATLMPRVAISFATALISNLPKIVEGFAKEMLKIPEQFVKALLNAIPGGGNIASGAGGILKKITPFAEGGRVPDLPRFEGDRFPARLNAGEQVLSKDLSSQLEQFLAGGQQQQQSNQPIIVQLQVGQQELARTMLNLNRGGFRVS